MKRLVVGLGNPGADYVWTPHNLGFHVVEKLCADAHLIFEPSAVLGLSALTAPCRVARHTKCDALLVEPLTYMNGSGLVVATLSRALGVPSEEVLVVYDDLDLPLGALASAPTAGQAATAACNRSSNDSAPIVSRACAWGSDARGPMRRGMC